MKKILGTVLLMVISFNCFAQASNTQGDIMYKILDREDRADAFGISNSVLERAKGSPYANENFLTGIIYKEDKVLRSSLKLRYNIFSDEIEIEQPSGEGIGSLYQDPDIYVKILNDIYVFVPLNGSNEQGGYFKIVQGGDYWSLYKKTTVTFEDGKLAKTSYDRDIPARFVDENTYYLVNPRGDFFEFPVNSKSKVLKIMDSHKSEMKAFINKSDINLNEDKDLVRLIKYYNSLQ